MNAFLKVFNNLKDDGWVYFVIGCTARSIFLIQYVEIESKKPHTNMKKELRILFISLKLLLCVIIILIKKSNNYYLKSI